MKVQELLENENDKDFLMFQDAVFKEMSRIGIADEEWGIALQSQIRDAYEEGADVMDVVQSLATIAGSDSISALQNDEEFSRMRDEIANPRDYADYENR